MVHHLVNQDQAPAFSNRMDVRARRVRSWLCVGLDPAVERLPAGLPHSAAGVATFCTEIINATHDLAVAFKINFAFFESLGAEGWRALETVRCAIPDDVPVIADAKRGDIAHTASAYARAVFEVLQFDAMTVSPYIGWDAVVSFAAYPGTCLFVLCKTSNPGAGDVQDLRVGDEPLYLRVARDGLMLSTTAEVGFVVGATQHAALRDVRALSEGVLLLVPGVGSQGAEARTTLQLGANRQGNNAIVPISREILYASPGEDFAHAARTVTTQRARELWTDSQLTHVHR